MNMKQIKQKADNGDATAQWQYAVLKNCEPIRDIAEILSYLEKSVKQDNAYAQYLMSYFLFYGDGCEKDIERAKILCEKSIQKGCKQAERLQHNILKYEEISQRKIPITMQYQILYHAWNTMNAKILEPYLSEDVVLVDILTKPIKGHDDVLLYLTKKFQQDSDNGIKRDISLLPTERYGNILEIFRRGYRRCLVICKTDECGKIDRIAIQPSVYGDLSIGHFSNCTSEPYPIEMIAHPHLKTDNQYNQGFMFCTSCGRLSYELEWFNFEPIEFSKRNIQGRISICPQCKKQVEHYIELKQKEFMENSLSNIYKSLKAAIAKNIRIHDLEDFNVPDASFITDIFNHTKLDDGMTLGLYRHGYSLGSIESNYSNFYMNPYVHYTDASEEFVPKLIPVRKGLLQILRLKSCNYAKKEYRSSIFYSPKMLIYNIIDDIMAESIRLPNQFATTEWNEEAIWEMFLLDNLKYFLPTFGHATYKRKDVICSEEDIEELPPVVKRFAESNLSTLLPKVLLKNERRDAIIVCHYFNPWEGLIKWTIPYHSFSESYEKRIRIGKLVLPSEKKEVVVPFMSSTRY